MAVRLTRLLPLALLVAPVATPEAPLDDMNRLARSSNAFGLDLYGKLRSVPGNAVVSPASVTTALAMTWGGARGETAAEMQKVLRLEASASGMVLFLGRVADPVGK
jgi:serpin B